MAYAPWLSIGVLAVVISTGFTSQAIAVSNPRPFWTEKSSFIEGDELFVVGVASHVRSMEEGRQKAFEHGKVELMNFAQVTDVEAQGIVIETQMTYEESNADGTVTVFRLLRVPVTKLVAIQDRLRMRSLTQEKALEQTRQELRGLQDSLAQRQQELEARTRTVQQALTQLSQLQSTLSEKAQKIDQQQRQVEQLLQQLASKYQVKGPQAGAAFDTLKQAEAQLEKREQELDGIYRRAIERIRANSQKACQYVVRGMKPSEVRGLLGEPDGRLFTGDHGINTWTYGTSEVHFDSQAVVSRVDSCGGR